MRGCRLAVVALQLLLLGCGFAAVGQAKDEPIDASLREAVARVPVAGTGASIVLTVYRPPGNGPFPWILLSHGTAPNPQANLEIGRWRNPALMREWLARGYAVVVPIRRGYGASSGGRLGDDRGSCAAPDYRGAGEGAAKDLEAAIAWARTQRDLDPGRWMLVGQSAGGFASIYAASRRPSGLKAVLAMSAGRGGDPVKHPGKPCAPERMAELLASITPHIAVPVLWFYAENDQYIGAQTQQLWYRRFQAAGGRGTLVVTPPFPHRLGHGVFVSPEGLPLWTAAVTRFLREHRIDMPFGQR